MSPPHATTVHFDDPSPSSADIKRGISVPRNFNPKHFAIYKGAIQSGKIGWLFNWEMWKPKGLPSSIMFVPQCRTAKEVDQIIPRIARSMYDDQTEHFLGFNEPCINTQANISVSEAVLLWKEHVLPLHSLFPSVHIGSPSIANGPHGLPWLISFISDLGGIQASGIDHISIHVYHSSFQAFKAYIEEIYDAFGLPIWVTEFACTNWDLECPVGESEVLAFMRECVGFLEEAEFVERYAWFGAREDVGDGVGWANALQKEGMLTEAGRLYLSL
ncbi:hypothetical protein BLS_001105 [Venturia inaequalis]|uniref:Asl1-like glycosyl hydrolase catalytic domain-containing protein n=1 Tax=Venturia inaequalis TaxID=5025 RepID=A0A8H3UYN6_VENIN|nr:hypothetical protein BLS_001105 [Venturia inaequalis]